MGNFTIQLSGGFRHGAYAEHTAYVTRYTQKMNERGHYGASRLGQTADDVRHIARVIEPRSAFYDPEGFKVDPEVARAAKQGWWKGSAPILIGSLAAIVGIAIIGSRRGMKLM